MKNNRLTNNELYQLKEVATRLRELASLENAGFAPFEQDSSKGDAYIKKQIKPYMEWFKCEAYKIESILASNK